MYSEDHHILRDAVGSFLRDCDPKDPTLGEAIVEQGWSGLLIDERYGGSAMDVTAACVLAEQIGRHLLCSPVLCAALIPSYVLQREATEALKSEWLPRIASGDTLVTLDASGDDGANNCVEQVGGELVLSGEWAFVPDLDQAEAALLPVTHGDGSLAMVLTQSVDMATAPFTTLDDRKFAKATLSTVAINPTRLLGAPALSTARHLGALIFAAEQYGSAIAAFELTVDYLKERKQFGRNLGSFQALQHRVASLYTELTMLEALVIKASVILQAQEHDAEKFCSMAKAKAGRVAALVTNEAIQLHGGIGMTEEYAVGRFIKRVAVSEKMFGDSDCHTDRVAVLSGF
ncbi:MAG: acyl-CoA dehydrogenase family protein [Pseudomonadota bacterium]